MQVRDLQQLKEYDVWATAKILAQAEQLTPEQFTAVPEGSERSVRDTLVHTMSTEQNWRTGWITGERISGLDANDFPTCASIAERWHEEDQITRDYLAGLSDADLERDFYGLGPLGMTITHVMMHGMQHRAEAAMMLTAYGHSPGDIDLVFFLMEQAEGKES
jgi:uncharacterized damage-inducible protein DinB